MLNRNKLIVNLIFYLTKYMELGITQEKIKKISNDEIKVIDSQELIINRISNCAFILFNNIKHSFNEELISQGYYLLANELLDENIINNIILIYYKNIDVAPHSLAALLHLYITKNITKNNIEFAFLISNYVMLKKGRWFLMPYEYCHNDYKEAIENNDLSSLIRIFYDIELVKKEKKPCLLPKNEVIQIIKSIKEELVNNYYIDKLYLFGSFAKGNNTDKSDLDFVAIFNESLINKEKSDMIKKVKNYLSNEFNCDVDLLDFSYELDTFDKSQKEYLITLI